MQDRKDIATPQPINNDSGLSFKKQKISFIKSKLFLSILAFTLLLIGFFAISFGWYSIQNSAVDSKSNTLQKVVIKNGSSPVEIATQLKEEGLIKDSFSFRVYLKLSGKENKLQAGTYRISKSESVSQIVDHLISGNVDQFTITFYPGATLVDNTDKDRSKKTDVTTVLENAGYSTEEIKNALNAKYDSPLFTSKPANTDLEGYIYGETYNFNVGSSVSDIFKRVFDEFYSDLTQNNAIEGFEAHGLNLYEGITLASIVQREVNTPDDQKQVAQVFYSRLAMGMELGSDVTYQYIADKTGVERDPGLNSPYNTRKYPGLTPGPIAAPGLSALIAVANPATGDYLYFLSGDDDITYFAKTYAEHESNIINHCKEKCLIL